MDFAVEKVRKGVDVREAVLLSCKARPGSVIIAALARIGGVSVILTDPIFQGMAVSLLFGVLVTTLLTLIVIPLGCVIASNRLQRIAIARNSGTAGSIESK